jgi:threonine/homoserine/homoserine lactone efflux protein
VAQLNVLAQGFVIGFSVAAPVGPIGLLCIRRSLADGPRIGLLTGLGAAAADAVYGAVAAFGLTAVSGLLVNCRFLLGLIGGLFLLYLGVRTFVAKPREQCDTPPRVNSLVAFAATFVLTLTNPMTILSFAAVFAGLGIGAAPNYRAAAMLVLGVFVGSALWWLLLSSGVGLVRSRMTQAWMRWVNRSAGVVIVCFGVYALVSACAQRH